MKCKYREIRKISADSLRDLCIAKNWYAKGTCKDYRHLLFDLADSKGNITTDDIVEIAQDIMDHSYTVQEFTSVCFDIAKIAVTFFEPIELGRY